MSGLKIVDGVELEEDVRAHLRPDELVQARDGRMHRLPRFFYEVGSWEDAKATLLAPHFALAELMTVDCRESGRLLRELPRYVPCAVCALARVLEAFREVAGGPVFVSANGGYRSPSHQRSQVPDSHCWGTAADIYKVGDVWLDTPDDIEKFGRMAGEACPESSVKPAGSGEGETDDHLHLEIGFLRWVPSGMDET